MHPVQLGHQIFGFLRLCVCFCPPLHSFCRLLLTEVVYPYTRRHSFSAWRFVRLHTPNSPTSSCVPFPFDWKGPPVFLLEATTPDPGTALPGDGSCLPAIGGQLLE